MTTRTSPRRGRELSAAAARFTNRRLRSTSSASAQGWQERAWAFYDSTPEVRFASRWTGNAMSRARLYAGRRNADGSIEEAPEGHRAAELVAGIAGGPEGQAALLGSFGPHLVVPGEGWIIVRPKADKDSAGAPGEDWRVLSVLEVKQQGNKLTAEIDGDPVEIPPYDPDQPPDPAAPLAIRVWEPHPRRHIEADSPVRSAVGLLEELHLLNAAVAAIARSRLTGRGILLIPKGTKFPSTPTQGDAEDDVIDVLMTVAETAYREPESAAATVPIVLEVPGELIGDIKRLTFESDFDELALKLREEAIRRFATGLEIPAEVLLGMGDINHWGQWAVSEEAIRLGVEPKLGTVAHALTTQWLRPLLDSESVEDAGQWLVWYDTAQLRVRANRSQTAIELFKLDAINGPAVRRETGFDESDAPTPEQQARRDAQTPDGERPDNVTELPVSETTGEPATLPAAATVGEGLLAAADGLIWAALSSAGRKLERTPACPRSERARARTVTPAALHTMLTVSGEQVEQWRLLDGAWTRAPEIAARYGLDPDCLTRVLDDYCRELIAAGVEHTWEQTSSVLRADCVVAA